MLRSAFISLSKAQWAQRLVTRWKIAWRVASRFIAGENTADALRVVKQLNDQGIFATLDHLGEHTTDRTDAARAVQEIFQILENVNQEELQSNVSIKLTQIGVSLDVEMAYDNLLAILSMARKHQNFVRVDMEDSSLTQVTLNLVLRAWDAGYHNLGTVIQSYLFRSEADVRHLADRGVPIRLVKGAYKEPPHLAFPKKKDVDSCLDKLTNVLIENSIHSGTGEFQSAGRIPPVLALATHDVQRIRHATKESERVGLPKKALEIQMLYGIRRDLQQQLMQQGYPVRVYVPFGTQWYPYFMRRLAERPANVWFFISSLVKK